MRLLALALCAFISLSALCQTPPSDDEEPGEAMPVLGASGDYLTRAIDFSLSFLRFSSRPYIGRRGEVRLNDILLNDAQTGYVPYGELGSMLSLSQARVQEEGLLFQIDEPGMQGRKLYIEPLDGTTGGKAIIAFSNRTYTYRAQGQFSYTSPRGWSVMGDVSRRWGQSLSTRGVWADAMGAVVALRKDITDRHTLQILASVSPSDRAMAAPATREAMELAGSNRYNPSWGMWGERERSARVRGTIVPMMIVNHDYRADDKYTLRSALFVRAGRSSQSALNWGGAPNPLPDYWAAMPSAQPTEELAQIVAQGWIDDVSVRQINFRELTGVNSSSDRAKYIIEDRVRDIAQVTAQSALFGPSFSAGVALTYATSRNYKRMEDLLGANYWMDVDNFLEDDNDLKDFTSNNTQNPDRRIVRGDEFGYNYTMRTFRTDVWGAYRWESGRWSLTAAASLWPKVDQREGHYEKQNFAGYRSLGLSEPVITVGGQAKFMASYRSTGRWKFDIALGYQSLDQTTDKLFISPSFRNELSPNRNSANLFGGELRASYRKPGLSIRASAYYMASVGESSLQNLYDDLRHAYVHYAMGGLDLSYTGLEASLNATLVPSTLSLQVGLAVQNNIYTSNPVAREYKESTGEEIVSPQRVIYKGLHRGGAPEIVGVVALQYTPLYGLSFVLTINGFGSAYAIPSPVRRTYDALQKAASAEAMVDMQSQERLPAGFTLDLFVGKTWRFDSSDQRLGLYCGVNNMLNKLNVATVGYESGRLRNLGTSYSPALTPHASKYYFAQGANFFVNLTYSF